MVGRQRLIAALLLLCVAATVALLHQSGPVNHVQNLLTEWRSSLAKRPVTGEVTFLAIDKASIDHIGQWPWPRRVHAQIIDRLVDAGAAEIAFDIDFSTPSNPDDDRLLAEALKRANGSVILAAFRQSASIYSDNLTMETNQPISALLDHAWPASVNVLADTDGKVRTVPISQMTDGDMLPSLPALLAGTTGSDVETFAVDFSIDATQVPAHSVKGLLTDRLAPDALHGKKVIVGATTLELHDTLAVPVYGLLPGPLLQVLATETLLQDRALQSTSSTTGLALLGCFLLLAIAASWWLRLWIRWPVLIGSALGLEIGAWVFQMQSAIVGESAPVHLATAGFLLSTLAVELYFRRIRIELAKQKNSDLLRVFSKVTKDNFDAIVVCDDSGSVLFESDIAREVLGLAKNNRLTGTEFSSVLPSQLVPVFEEMIARLRRGAVPPPESGEMPFERTDGTEAVLDYIFTPSLLPAGKYDRWIGRKAGGAVCFTARDVTSDRHQRAKIEYLAEHDSLTGALNRHSFVKLCDDDRSDAASCMFVVELHGMEVVNGTFGLETGEKVMVEAVQRLRMCGGWAIEVARIETHRFAFRLQGVKCLEKASQIASAIADKIEEPFEIAKSQTQLRCMIGLATSWQVKGDTDAQLRAAEVALTNAGDTDKRVSVYDDIIGYEVQRSLKIERALWGALEDNEFELVFQPQVGVRTGKTTGAEALVRWENGLLGKVNPDEFIPLAESNGAIAALGTWTLEAACKIAVSWPGKAEVSVNLSAVQLRSGDLPSIVKRVLEETGLEPSRLVIELTETAFALNANSCIRQMRDIRLLGVKLAIDDFGTGFSSLQYLSRLPVDVLKIDRAFVVDLDENEDALPIINAIAKLSDTLGLKVCCEGVETQRHVDIVRNAGCDIVQGYFFSKPLSARDMAQRLIREAADESDRHVA